MSPQVLAGAREWRVYDAPVMDTSTDSPGVHVPPPLFYAVAIIAGWLLNRVTPLHVGDRRQTVLGWMLAAASALLAASAVGLFRRKHTSIVPIRPAATLVTSGPYAFTRNPMYVSLALLTIAFALFLNTWWIVLLLVPTLLIIQQFVIVPEERYLWRRFTTEYEAYTRRVRRWL
jgi:protein-S-isoprenylcysteine O-methyltransferase Ste14